MSGRRKTLDKITKPRPRNVRNGGMVLILLCPSCVCFPWKLVSKERVMGALELRLLLVQVIGKGMLA